MWAAFVSFSVMGVMSAIAMVGWRSESWLSCSWCRRSHLLVPDESERIEGKMPAQSVVPMMTTSM